MGNTSKKPENMPLVNCDKRKIGKLSRESSGGFSRESSEDVKNREILAEALSRNTKWKRVYDNPPLDDVKALKLKSLLLLLKDGRSSAMKKLTEMGYFLIAPRDIDVYTLLWLEIYYDYQDDISQATKVSISQFSLEELRKCLPETYDGPEGRAEYIFAITKLVLLPRVIHVDICEVFYPPTKRFKDSTLKDSTLKDSTLKDSTLKDGYRMDSGKEEISMEDYEKIADNIHRIDKDMECIEREMFMNSYGPPSQYNLLTRYTDKCAGQSSIEPRRRYDYDLIQISPHASSIQDGSSIQHDLSSGKKLESDYDLLQASLKPRVPEEDEKILRLKIKKLSEIYGLSIKDSHLQVNLRSLSRHLYLSPSLSSSPSYNPPQPSEDRADLTDIGGITGASLYYILMYYLSSYSLDRDEWDNKMFYDNYIFHLPPHYLLSYIKADSMYILFLLFQNREQYFGITEKNERYSMMLDMGEGNARYSVNVGEEEGDFKDILSKYTNGVLNLSSKFVTVRIIAEHMNRHKMENDS